MATKEVKELSIESIKKELIDKFVNDMDILRYLEIERHDVKLSQVQNTFVYDQIKRIKLVKEVYLFLKRKKIQKI